MDRTGAALRIAVFGAGGIGGYLGGRLAQAGEEVLLIARGPHLDAIREHGLKVDSINGDFVVRPAGATDAPSEVGVVDAVILGVKAWQVTDAAADIRPMVGPETVVLPVQNGVEAPAQLAAVLGQEHVIGGLGGIISYIVGPGHIRHAGGKPFVRFGELDSTPSERTRRLLQAFLGAGVSAEIPSDIQAAMWQKLLFISPWSGVGAVTRSPIGVWRSLKETREMATEVMKEVLAVAQARDIALTYEAVESAWASLDGLPHDSTSSMQRDVMEGRPSELEFQNGAAERLGRDVGVSTPVNSFIYHSLLPQEMQARGQGSV